MENLNMNKLSDIELEAATGGVAKKGEIKVRPIADGEWYRLLIYDPKGGTCYAYIAKRYTVVD